MPALIVSQVISSGLGFSRKRRTPSVRFGLDQAVGGGVVDRRQHDRGLRLALAVQLHHRVQIDLRQHVAVEDDDRAVEVRLGELDRAAGAERRGLDQIANRQPDVRAVAEDLFDAAGLVVQAEDHLGDARHLLQQVELVVQERPIENRNDGLGRVQGQRTQPRAFAAGEKDGFHGSRR